MFLEKVSRDSGAEGIIYSVTVEPLPGHTDEEIVARLAEIGATEVKILAAGFISARASRESMRRLEDIAAVQIKPTKQLRS